MKIRWEFNDGYAGKHRYQYLEIDDEDLTGLSKDKIEIEICSIIEEAIIDMGYYWEIEK